MIDSGAGPDCYVRRLMHRLGGRAGRAALAAAGLAVLVLAVLFHRGGPVAAADTEHVRLSGSQGPLDDNVVATQRFTAAADGLSSIAMRFATSGGVTDCIVIASLHEVAAPDVELARSERRCPDVPDSELIDVLRPAPIAGSAGREYEIDLRTAKGSTETVRVWSGVDEGGRLPEAAMGASPLPLSFELHTAYGDDAHAWSQLGTALNRMSFGRPGWQTPPVIVLLAVTALACVVALVVVRGRAAAIVLVGLAVAKGVLWTIVLPPLTTPDEPAHVAYAQFMAEQRKLPKRGVAQDGLPNAYSVQYERTNDVYHVFAAPPGDRVDQGPGSNLDAELRGLPAVANGDGAATGYPPHYYVGAALLYELAPGRLDQKVEYMRLWSVVLSAITAVASYFLGRRLFRGSEAAGIALAVAVVLQPMLSQQAASVNGDSLLVASSTLALLGATELLRPAGERRRGAALLTTGAGGLAILAKLFGVALLPVVGVCWLIGRRRAARAQRPPLWRDVAELAAGLAVTYGSWAVFAAIGGYKGPKVSDLAQGRGPRGVLAFLRLIRRNDFANLRKTWVDGLWGDFSNLNTPYPDWIRRVIIVALLTGMAVVLWATARVALDAVRRRRRESAAPDLDDGWDGATFVAGLLTVLATLAVLYAVTFLTFRRTAQLELLQGRYSLLALPMVLALPALAVRVLRLRVSATAVVVTVAGSMAVLQVFALAVLTERFYL